jgi:hypothetical protein
MVKNILCCTALVACCLVVFVPNVSAAEKKYELKSAAATVKDVLVENTGKRVTLQMAGSERLEGTVSKVGDHVVHIARLRSKEFFDAVVSIDRINAVVFRTRTK